MVDRAEGLRRDAADDSGWIARAVARVDAEPAAALADLDRALAANPRSLPALEGKAHVLSERFGRPAEAFAVLDWAVALYPDDGAARAARGVLRARLGGDADAALAADDSSAVRYRAAGVFALAGRRDVAVALLAEALGRGYGADLLPADRDLDSLRGDPAFEHLLGAAALQTRAPPVHRPSGREPTDETGFLPYPRPPGRPARP